MSNASKAAPPRPEQVRAARKAAGLTQTEAAELVYKKCRTWQQWEASVDDVKNHRKMDPAVFELFNIKVKRNPST